MSKFRKGDRVAIVGIIKHDQDEDKRLFVDVVGSHETLWMEPKDLTLTQYSFEVSDQCVWESDDGKNGGTILAINNDHAWIDLGNGDYCTRLLTTIERIDSDD